MRIPYFSPQSSGGRPFDLVSWFSAACFGTLAMTTIGTALLLSGFIERQLLALDARAARDFVQTVTRVENVDSLGGAPGAKLSPQLAEYFSHVSQLPEVVRTNVYGRDRTVLWSSDPALMGRRFADNDELDAALGGEVVVKRGYASPERGTKPEHIGFSGRVFFVESYIPVATASDAPPLAVVELYRAARTLEEMLGNVQMLVWISAIAGGAILFLVLLGIVRRAAREIERQQVRLIESDRLAMVGEMGGTVAHGIRNPLASIRSSAELALDDPGCTWREQAHDVIAAADRIEGSIRKLLSFARKPAEAPAPAPVALNDVARGAVADLEREFRRRGIASELALDVANPMVVCDAALLREVIASLVANALEAMDDGGTIRVSSQVDRRRRRTWLAITDDGPGMAASEVGLALRPFHTTKPQGLGLGLPLAKRVVERHGGKLAIDSAPGRGTSVRIELPVAR